MRTAGGDARPTGLFLSKPTPDPDPWYLRAHSFNQAAAPASIGYIPYNEVIPGGRHEGRHLVDPGRWYAHGRVRAGIL